MSSQWTIIPVLKRSIFILSLCMESGYTHVAVNAHRGPAPDMDTENQIHVLCKSSKHSQPRGHISSPPSFLCRAGDQGQDMSQARQQELESLRDDSWQSSAVKDVTASFNFSIDKDTGDNFSMTFSSSLPRSRNIFEIPRVLFEEAFFLLELLRGTMMYVFEGTANWSISSFPLPAFQSSYQICNFTNQIHCDTIPFYSWACHYFSCLKKMPRDTIQIWRYGISDKGSWETAVIINEA